MNMFANVKMVFYLFIFVPFLGWDNNGGYSSVPWVWIVYDE